MADIVTLNKGAVLTRSQLAAALKVTEQTVLDWQRAGMPHIGYGHTRLYRVDDILAWMERQNARRGRRRKRGG